MNLTTKPGRLIGASLGPGDPASSPAAPGPPSAPGRPLAYPVKKAEESSHALGIVRRGGLEVPADAEALVFPMTRDPVALARPGRGPPPAASSCCARAATWSSWSRATPPPSPPSATWRGWCASLAPEVEVRPSPACRPSPAAAATGLTLAEEDETFAVVPPPTGCRSSSACSTSSTPSCCSRSSRCSTRCSRLLARRGLLATSCFIEKVGAPDERVVRDVACLAGEKVNYLAAPRPEPQAGARRTAPRLPQTPRTLHRLTAP